MNAFQLPDETRVSQVHLRTADLERVLGFYHGVLGLRVTERTASTAVLSASETGPPLILLTEDRNAAPRPARATGLFHLAIRYPTRHNLAHALQRLAQNNYP